jgi:uncharacterized iron-regulated membrane protein
MKRYLYLTHRWLGIALCLFMAMWFFSGVVMMYVGYPRLTLFERLASLPALDATGCCVGIDAALAASGETKAPQSMRLTSVAGAPRYVLEYENNRSVAIDARSGSRIASVDAAAAVAAARSFRPDAESDYRGVVDEDAWTHSKALEGHRPMHKVQMADADGTLLYVSGTTGEVVRDATRTERIWNWVGAWIHYLYMFRGGPVDPYWKDIIVYTSLTATALAVLGLVVGLLRWRFDGRYKSGSKSPYRDDFMRWHHYAGLIFGLTVATWVFSGLMSMNPWKVFDTPTRLDMRAYAGGELGPKWFGVGPGEALRIFDARDFHPREIELRLVDGVGYYIGHNEAGLTLILPATPGAEVSSMFPSELLQKAGARLVGGASVKEATVLTAYDFYYYGRAPHTMAGTVEKRLPVVRIAFDDTLGTWAHIDPYTGAVLGKYDSGRRGYRWLFAFPHSWDWRPLIEARPLWDVVMLLLCGGGFALSVTGVVIGWRRLFPRRRARKSQLGAERQFVMPRPWSLFRSD